MKRIIIAAAAVLAILAVTSCKKDPVLMYNVVTFGNIDGSTFTTDRGVVYHITEQTCEGSMEGQERWLIVCDVLKKLGEGEYNIRLVDFVKPLLKDPVNYGEVPEVEAGDNPIGIGTGWIGGGYLNLQALFHFKQSDGAKHYINLMRDEDPATAPFPDDTLYYRLYHNAGGEYPGGEISLDEMVYGYCYCCFPIAADLPEEKDAMPIKVTWRALVEGTDEDPYPTALFNATNTLTR